MISIVFCSKDPSQQYIEHLKNSCGVKDVEVIAIKNDGSLSLSQSYNYGLNKSKHNTVVFTHDDVAFNTKSWGYKVLKNFDSNPEFGIIGLAGTDKLINGRWWSIPNSMLGRVYHQKDGKRWLSDYSPSFGNKVVESVTVDGVFISVRKDRINKPFNINFLGFHFYDIPFCVDNYLSGVKVGVCTNIELTHFSVGETNSQWSENKALFESLYSKNFPMIIKRDISLPKEKNLKWGHKPKVSIIIPTKDKLDLLIPCLDSIQKTTYDNYEVLIADTGSTDENKETIKEYISDKVNFKLLEFDYYHFAKINNEVVSTIENPELLLFCNNDIELINDSISLMTNFYTKTKNVGLVGSRLHYEDGSIQHNGVVIEVNTKNNGVGANHIDVHKTIGYGETTKEVIGVTGALLMVSYEKFKEMGMFNESYKHCFEDVELGLHSILKGYKNYVVSESVSYHKESQTRNIRSTKEEYIEDFNNLTMKIIYENIETFKKYIKVIG
jgi:GT2 family glycosyltransferase